MDSTTEKSFGKTVQSEAELEYYLVRSQKLSKLSTDRVKKVLKIASSLSAERFLDIGCGDGTFTTLVGRIVKAKEIYGVDISPLAIRQAVDKGLIGKKVNIEKTPLPFEDDYFDLIFCGDIIEHLFDPENLLKESYRVLKRGGLLLLTTPNLASWHNRFSLLLGYQPFGTSGSFNYPRAGKPSFTAREGKAGIGHWGKEHLRVMTLKALKDLLRFNNFETLEVKGACITPAEKQPAHRIFGLIDRLMSLSPSLATWIVIKSKKI